VLGGEINEVLAPTVSSASVVAVIRELTENGHILIGNICLDKQKGTSG